MNEPNVQISLLRVYRSLAERHLTLLARQEGMHVTDVSALSHLFDQRRHGHVLTAGELGELLALSGPATTAAIDRLEKRGMVERRQSPVDGRRVEVHLSEEFAPADRSTMFAELGQVTSAALAKHSASEIAAFEAVLADICDAVADLNQRKGRRD